MLIIIIIICQILFKQIQTKKKKIGSESFITISITNFFSNKKIQN